MSAREFLVVKVGRKENTNKARIFPMGQQIMEEDLIAPARPAPRPLVRGANLDELRGNFILNQPQQINQSGFIAIEEKESPVVTFFDEDAAKEYARQQAAKYPTQLFGVFPCVEVFETTEPKVITKIYNGSGELIPIAKETQA